MPSCPPMLKQYRQIKARYPDALVLYRLGDFYELFESDAELVARQLGLVLTQRRFAKDVHLPMCGIPHHRLTGYLARLIKLGHKVAIAEQLEDASKTKRLVKRQVIRVITPGTIVEDALLQSEDENLLAGIVRSAKPPVRYGLSAVDLSTGEFATTQIEGQDAESAFWEEIAQLCPRELVLPQSLANDSLFTEQLRSIHPVRISPLPDHEFAPEMAARRLCDHLRVLTLEGYGCQDLPLAVSAAGGVLYYLLSNQISDLAHIVRLRTYDLAQYVVLDATTRRNLEISRTMRDGLSEGTLLKTLDRTSTAMGARMLKRWIGRPLLDIHSIQNRQEAIGELVDRSILCTDLCSALDGMYDVERLVGRIGFGAANARDLVALRQVLERIPIIARLLGDAQSKCLRHLLAQLDVQTANQIADQIAQALVDDPPILLREGGIIRQGYAAELEALRQVAAEGHDWLATFEAQERARTGIKNLRVQYNQVFGFFIQVTQSNLNRVPQEYERRATIRHAERFVTAELKRHELEILDAEDKIKQLEYELFVHLRAAVAAESASLTQLAHVLAELDTLTSLAQVAALNGYVRPTVDAGSTIVIQGGRHPVVEQALPDGERFVPNDTDLGDDKRLMILTGPNMSGKSVYIRQVALIVLLAQIGSFVPAREARIGLVDGIFVRAGAADDIARGRSTFLVEMSETGYILHHATSRSLVILDEVGKGTSTYDGMSIAWAVAEELHDEVGAKTLFATHFHELTRLSDHLPAARNYTLAIVEQGREIVFLRQLIPEGANRSYGIQVARLAGLPDHVVDRAQAMLAGFEQKTGLLEVVSEAHPHVWSPQRQETPRRPIGGMDASIVYAILSDLYNLDIANMTPVQALVRLNELQCQLGRARIDQEFPGGH
jgi:DNA mismatch repair protein MutS